MMQVKGDPIADLAEDLGAEAAPYHTAIGFCHFFGKPKSRCGTRVFRFVNG